MKSFHPTSAKVQFWDIFLTEVVWSKYKYPEDGVHSFQEQVMIYVLYNTLYDAIT